VRSLAVLMYHSVPRGSAPPSADRSLSVPLGLVRDQWWTLREAGLRLRGLTEALATVRADPGSPVVGLTFDDGYADFLGAVDLLGELDAQATLYLPTDLVGGRRRIISSAGRLLGWGEIAGLPGRHVEIGSHSCSHRPLDVLSHRELAEEVGRSRTEIEDRLGASVVSFCYPNGYASRRVRTAVADAGYANGCVVGRRLAEPKGDSFTVPRLQVLPTHDQTGILRLVREGEPGVVPCLKRAAHPAWRLVRRATYLSSGRLLT
jgi:peptidoglycan/xylan/chitin deacetylase (PgdA/CDA1 family)